MEAALRRCSGLGAGPLRRQPRVVTHGTLARNLAGSVLQFYALLMHMIAVLSENRRNLIFLRRGGERTRVEHSQPRLHLFSTPSGAERASAHQRRR